MMLSESGIRVSAVIVDVMMPPPPGSHVLRHRVGLAHIILPIRAGHFAPVLPRDIAIAALTSNADFEINEEISAADAEVFFKGVAPELLLSWINSIRQE